MRRRAPAFIVLFGIVSTVGAWLSLDLLYACLAALATITYAAFAPSIVRSTPTPRGQHQTRHRCGAGVRPIRTRR